MGVREPAAKLAAGQGLTAEKMQPCVGPWQATAGRLPVAPSTPPYSGPTAITP
jgi:hypothetical protein